MHPLSVPSSTGVQPMMMDVNGDMKIDLLGLAPGSPSTFKIWQNVYNSSQPQSPPFYVCVARSLRDLLYVESLAAQTPTSMVLHANLPTLIAMLSST
jgi:hypothetical protein